MGLDFRSTVASAEKASSAVDFAMKQVGLGYGFGKTGPKEYDCSGLVVASIGKLGWALPHNSGQQVQFFKRHRALGYATSGRTPLVPGDVVFYYGSPDNPASVSHCALYVGRSKTGLYMVVAAVDEHYGVKCHRMRWALRECGYGYTHLLKEGAR